MDQKYILKEIEQQPDAWEKVIAIVAGLEPELRAIVSGTEEIVLTGCGSALNVSYAAAPILQRFTGRTARAVPAADFFQFPEAYLPARRKPLMISISRSGETTETVFAQRLAGERGCATIALTCFESAISRQADLAIILTCCQETSICTTNSVTGMLLALQLMAATGDRGFRAELERLPEAGHSILDRAMELGQRLGEDQRFRKFAFIGSGPFYGIARECQLKAKEMTLLPADAYPVMDYRHGPKSNVDQSMLVAMLCSDRGRKWEQECADELMGCGGQLLVVSDSPVMGSHTLDFYLNRGLSEYARGPLYLPVFQTMATYKAINLGLDPNAPRNLSYWVKTTAVPG